ncbi:MAG: glycosyltransferase [Leptolyngbyaceae cyanobacterium bins.302]|nr:glycosyltransferase [Leptolyngbyaceae cyanobacterium bins.302]
MQRSRLQALQLQQVRDGLEFVLLDDRVSFADLASMNPARSIGIAAFENTQLDQALIQHIKQLQTIIVGSAWSANCLKNYGLHSVQVQLQGIDPALFYPGAKTNLLGDRFVIFSNSCNYVKGQDILLAAFKAFHSRHADTLLLLAGEPVEGMADDGRSDAVIALEPIAYSVLGQVLREVDVAVFPSRCEVGINPTIAASLACGIPTILSNNTANQDLVRLNLGFSLSSQRSMQANAAYPGVEGWGESEVEELVEVLEYIYAHPQAARNKGAIAADFMRDRTWQKITTQLISVLNPVS